MTERKTVMLNGRHYDASTGLPVGIAQHKPAESAHSAPQRSKTLQRRVAKKPVTQIAKRPATGRHMDIARSGTVTRFAAHPELKKTVSADVPDAAARPHPVAAKALHHPKQSKRHLDIAPRKHQPAAATKPAKVVKEEEIHAALAKAERPSDKEIASKKRLRKLITILGLVFLLLGVAAATYIALPSISVSIAAAQAGVKATYPKYVPNGYQLSQPVEYSDGSVSLVFVSNSGGGEYSINQTRSSWNSSATLDNVVRPAAGENYVINQERGLTIYTYESSAVWVNGGVLYQIDSNAPLSGEQIRRIATSL